MDLKENQYIELQFAENNKKEKILVLTPAGEEYITQLVSSMDKVESVMAEKMGEEKLYLLANLLLDYGEIIKEEIVAD